MEYPIYFTNKDGNKCAILSKEKSTDGTPRYFTNPKCKNNTYPLEYCLNRWTPYYKKTTTTKSQHAIRHI